MKDKLLLRFQNICLPRRCYKIFGLLYVRKILQRIVEKSNVGLWVWFSKPRTWHDGQALKIMVITFWSKLNHKTLLKEMNNCQFLDKCAAPETSALYTFRRLAVLTSSGKRKGTHFVGFVRQNLSAPLGYEAGICKYQKVRCVTQPPCPRRKIPRYTLYRRQGGFWTL